MQAKSALPVEAALGAGTPCCLAGETAWATAPSRGSSWFPHAARVGYRIQQRRALFVVLLADRDVEIVADRGLGGHVSADEWAGICRRMEQAFAKRGICSRQADCGRRDRSPAGGTPAGGSGRAQRTAEPPPRFFDAATGHQYRECPWRKKTEKKALTFLAAASNCRSSSPCARMLRRCQMPTSSMVRLTKAPKRTITT